jgi:hypothetical protein
MRLSRRLGIGIDAGCGEMLNRPWFRTKEYIGIDVDEKRLKEGLAAYPEALAIIGRLEEMKGVLGDLVLCVQVFQNKYFDTSLTMPVMQSLTRMVSVGGVLIFNIARRNLPYEARIDAFLSRYFGSVMKMKYGIMEKHESILGPIIAALMYLFPNLRYRGRHMWVYYRCQDRLRIHV